MYKVHTGCYLEVEEVVAMWSEKYSNPKLDQECYLAKVLLRNNSTILTIATYPTKEEADELISKISTKCLTFPRQSDCDRDERQG
jgi:hypothetical protein